MKKRTILILAALGLLALGLFQAIPLKGEAFDIQAEINALPLGFEGGGTVRVPHGTHLISAPLDFGGRRSVRLVGDGAWGTRIVAAGTALNANGDAFYVADLTMTCDRCPVVVDITASRGTLERVLVYNGQTGVRISGGSHNNLLTMVDVRSNGVGAMVADGANANVIVSSSLTGNSEAGIWARYITSLTIMDVTIENSRYGVLLSRGDAEGVHIERMHLENFTEAAISASPAKGLSVRDSYIYNGGRCGLELNGSQMAQVEGNHFGGAFSQGDVCLTEQWTRALLHDNGWQTGIYDPLGSVPAGYSRWLD